MSLTTMCALCYGVLGPLEEQPGTVTSFPTCDYCTRHLLPEEQKEAHVIEQTALGPRTFQQHVELAQGIFAALQKVLPNADRLEVGVFEGVPWASVGKGTLAAQRELWEALEKGVGTLSAIEMLAEGEGLTPEVLADLRETMKGYVAVLEKHRLLARPV